jgi:two-component system chemotaxis response regulator CheB
MAKRDLVVVGASAGGVEALRTLMSRLPPDFPATLLVTMHVSAGGSALPQILDRAGPLPARHAVEGDALLPGMILVAPPDHHLLVFDHAVTLSRGPKENGHRPAIDVLFRSAARALGHRVIGLVLSGALDDGAAGMAALRLRGGYGLVQDPGEAIQPSMPRSAKAAAGLEEALPVAKIPARLLELVSEELPEVAPDDADPEEPDLMDMETAMADLDIDALNQEKRPGVPSGLSCPECHGSLFEITEGGLVRYRCRVGHAWSAESLAAQQTEGLESALWMALRSLEEKAALSRDLARRSRLSGHRLSGEGFDRTADDALAASGLIRDVIDRIAGRVPDQGGGPVERA